MRRLLAPLALVGLLGAATPAMAAPEGTMTWGIHITLAARWLDPAETEGIITPFMVLYALHDALVKPMAQGPNTPSLAESGTASRDGCPSRGTATPATCWSGAASRRPARRCACSPTTRAASVCSSGSAVWRSPSK